ncbi:hypothetical protein HFV01_24595 [Limnospira fusiformis SAG 85.79]|nr:hypothetical protein HFV01_24595 [Limnospira fusiformis SAG 85.79]
MSLNSTVIMTIVLLVMMFGAGIFSSSTGYKLGRDALKEITQPDVRPSNISDRINNSSSRQEGVKLLREEDIIAQVKKRIAAGGVDPDTPPPQPQTQEKPKEEDQARSETTNQVTFPIVSSDGGVTMEITSTQRRSNSLQLNVNLKNESDQSVRFLYSFLNVTDDQGRALSASVDSLPGQLPPGTQTYTGTIAISTALLDNVQELAISLTDYPEQNLQLQMSGIPVAQ